MSLPGGNHAPFRENCPGSDECVLGPLYLHAKASQLGIARFLYVSTVTPQTSGLGVVYGPPPYERYAGFGAVSCETASGCEPGSDYESAFSGCPLWYDGDYTGSGIQKFNLAHAQPVHFTQPKMLAGAVIAAAGTGYTLGDVLILSGGTLADNGSAATVTVVKVGALGIGVTVTPTTRGSYWTPPTSPVTLTGGTGTGATITAVFTPELTDKYAVCRERGTKTAAAKLYWNGRFGFLNEDLDTKYLTIDHRATYSFDARNCLGLIEDPTGPNCGDTPPPDTYPYTCEAIAGRTLTVNKLSGVQTQTFCSDTGDFSGQSRCCYDGFTPTTSPNNHFLTDLAAAPIPSPGDTVLIVGSSHLPIITFTNTHIIAQSVTVQPCTNNAPNDVINTTLTVTVEITLSDSNTRDEINADAKYLLSLWDLADNNPFRTDGLPQICPLVTRNQVPGNVAPGTPPCTVNDVAGGLIDDATGKHPGDPGYVDTYAQIPWTDSNASLYDGEVVGAPAVFGYENQWDARNIDTRFCCGTTPFEGQPDIYTYGYGGVMGNTANALKFNTFLGTQLPLNGTQFTSLVDAIFFRPGAFTKFADKTNAGDLGCSDGDIGSDGALFMVKFATVKERFPSQDLARPGGPDKFLYDETQVYGVVNLVGAGVGSTWTLTDSTGATPAIADTSGYWGGPVMGGFYAIASYVAGVITLGAKKFNMPSDWLSKSRDDGFCFGKLRWPAAPGLIGRAAVLAIADSGGVRHLTTIASPSLGLDQTAAETVDICAADMTVLAANVTVTRVSDVEFTVPTALATIVAAKWIVPHLLADGVTPGTHYYWHDRRPKNQFVHVEFDFSASNTVSAVTKTQACLPFKQCDPQVICYSPNGEVFPNGVTYDIPDSTLDSTNGSQFQAEIIMGVVDPLAQTPHHPVGDVPDTAIDAMPGDTVPASTIAWLMDDGTGKEDAPGVMYYPFHPMVEPLISLPAGAPALPAGTALYFDTDPAPLPYIGVDFTAGALNRVDDERVILSRLQACVDGNGRFAAIYEDAFGLTPTPP